MTAFNYFPPQNVYLGSGTTFGGGYTDRNVNLGTVPLGTGVNPGFSHAPQLHPGYQSAVQPTLNQAAMASQAPAPVTATPQYDLEPGQVIMNKGQDNAMVVGKDAPRGWFGIPRAVTGAIDAVTNKTWLPDTDWDKRGTGKDSYGNLPDPGELGGAPVLSTEQVPQSPTQQNRVLGKAVPSATNMLDYYKHNLGIRTANQLMDNQMINQALNRGFNNLVRTRQFTDPADINFTTRMQQTPFGQSRLANEAMSRNVAITGAASEAANKKALLRNSLANMGMAAVAKATAGLQGSGRAIT